MPTVTLDTSGRVECSDPHKPCVCHAATWEQNAPFTQGYIEALFAGIQRAWGTERPYMRNSRDFCGHFVRFSDLAPDTLARIIADCAAYRAEMDERWGADRGDYWTAERGADFWGSRDGGAWINFPPLAPYLGDDGKVYLREIGS